MVTLEDIKVDVDGVSPEELEKLCKRLVASMKDGINQTNMFECIAEVYKEVTKFTKLSPMEKKALCKDILIYIVENTDSGKFDDQIDAIMKRVIPGAVDTFIKIENGQIKFGAPSATNFFNCCLSILRPR